MILITGASGYLGSALAKQLSLEKIPFEILENSYGSPFRLGDTPNVLQLSNAKLLIHLAWDRAAAHIGNIDINYVSTINVRDYCLLHQVKFLFISSYAVLFSPHTLYGRTKLAIENEILDKKGYVIRTALVISEPPGSALKRLLRVQRFLPFILDRAQKGVYVHTVALEQFTKCCTDFVTNIDDMAMVHNCGMLTPIPLKSLVKRFSRLHIFVIPMPSSVLKAVVKTIKFFPFTTAIAEALDGLYNSTTKNSDLIGDHVVCECLS